MIRSYESEARRSAPGPALGAICLAASLTACYSGGAFPGGLGPVSPDDTGPRILWDLDATPLPEIPFPNDVGTRPDGDSPTGLRVNVSAEAPTAHERLLRRIVGQMDGYGIFAPLWVRFAEEIDVADLHARQTDNDPTNDAVFLVNVDPGSPTYGTVHPLDFGPGPDDHGATRFPYGLEDPHNYFHNDPRAGHSNLIYETAQEEDANGNGKLDPSEDTDDDGVWDRPNLWGDLLDDDYRRLDPFVERLEALGMSKTRVHQYYDLVTCYERETNTLTFRPVVPLEQATTYAVVLTRDILGAESGSPIRAPEGFPFINHGQQTRALLPLRDEGLLQEVGVELGDVAFAWTFTTQTVTLTTETIRAGLYGEGKMSYLAESFPDRIQRVYEVEDPSRSDNVFILTGDRLMQALEDPNFAGGLGFSPADVQPLIDIYRQAISHLVFFEVDSPAFIDNPEGVFRVDPVSGRSEFGHETVYVTCAVPKERPGYEQPFPVAFYGHGYTSTRLEMLGFAGTLGRVGLTTCGFDAYGHGLPSTDLIVTLVEALLAAHDLEGVAEAVFTSRARDLKNDSVTDSGGDFWSANTFHTRDVVRQSMIDAMQIIRVMRGFGQGTMPADVNGDGVNDLAGDFDGDGVVDFGGDENYSMMGQSLGGIMAALVGSAEPAMRSAAPVAGGGGLTGIATRSYQGGVVPAVFLPLFGPLISGRISGEFGAPVEIFYDALDVNAEVYLPIAKVPDPTRGETEALRTGDRIRVTNLTNGEIDQVTVRGNRAGFRIHLPADRGDDVRIEIFRDGAQVPYRTITTFEAQELEFQGRTFTEGSPLVTPHEGFGFRRQSPSLRRMFAIAQMVLEPADPASYAPLYRNPRPVAPEGAVPTNLLVVNTVGDMNVPVDTGIHIARAAGLLSPEEDELLTRRWVVEGLEDLRRFAVDPCHYDANGGRILFDVDDYSEGTDPAQGPHLAGPARHPDCDGSLDEPSFCRQDCEPLAPLRATVRDDHGMSGMRIPFLNPTGIHGFDLPDANAAFDYNLYQINQIGWFFRTEGRELVDDPCLASHDAPCAFLPSF